LLNEECIIIFWLFDMSLPPADWAEFVSSYCSIDWPKDMQARHEVIWKRETLIVAVWLVSYQGWGVSVYATIFVVYTIILYSLHVSAVRPSSSGHIYIGN
jgi:hypothetical protein